MGGGGRYGGGKDGGVPVEGGEGGGQDVAFGGGEGLTWFLSGWTQNQNVSLRFGRILRGGRLIIYLLVAPSE